MDRFLDNLMDDTGLLGENYDYDPVEDLRLQLEQLEINQAKIARVIVIHAVLKSSHTQYKCSKCGKTGHNSCNCSKNKKKSKSRHSNKIKSRSKKKGKINTAIVNSDSDSNSDTNSSNIG